MSVFGSTSIQPALNKLARIDTKNPEIAHLQDRLDEFIQQFGDSKIITGKLLTDVDLVSGSETKVPHGLGRTANGCILVKSAVQLDIWQPTAPDGSNLSIQASANATVDLWVF